jgi:hypothetical protein
MRPETRYAHSGQVNIAYQVVGDGPRDLVVVPGWVSNIDLFWDEPHVARFLERRALGWMARRGQEMNRERSVRPTRTQPRPTWRGRAGVAPRPLAG